MGILNITPDSFHGQSRYETVESATKEAIAMAENGADWIDVGGESTRPGYLSSAPSGGRGQVVPVIKSIRDELPNIGISSRYQEIHRGIGIITGRCGHD